MKGDLRCVDGRLFRHDPQHDDPYLETDVGECPECVISSDLTTSPLHDGMAECQNRRSLFSFPH